MSGLAKVLRSQGLEVSGSDIARSRRTAELERLGIKIHHSHREENLNGAETVVFSSAIPRENVELAAAKRWGLPLVPRLKMLGHLAREKESTGVAGTHGKTTTTAMISFLLREAGLRPSFLVGASCPILGDNANGDEGNYLVAEIDESDGYFTELELDLAVITNVGADHLNNYRNAEAVYQAFRRFAGRSRQLIVNIDDGPSLRLRSELGLNSALTFGIGRQADLRAEEIVQHGIHTHFRLAFQREEIGTVSLPAPGRHNVYNALAALLAGWRLGLSFRWMSAALEKFALPERRFQVLRGNGVMIIDDYAHLPEEIEANLEAIRCGWRPRRVIAIFQPHRFSRVKQINGRFARSFTQADKVILTSIYPAGERPNPTISADLLRTFQHEYGKKVRFFPQQEEIIASLKRELCPGDFIISFGAGDICQVSHKLAASLEDQ